MLRAKRSAAGSIASPSRRAHEVRNPRCLGSPALWRAVARCRSRGQPERARTKAGPERDRRRNRRLARSVDTGAAACLAPVASRWTASRAQSRPADPSPRQSAARAKLWQPEPGAAAPPAEPGPSIGENGAMAVDPGLVLKTGTTLVRQWRGRTHTVLVHQDGFEHEGQRYRSLTAIAERITEAHWSGPRFFGLTRRARAVAGAKAGR